MKFSTVIAPIVAIIIGVTLSVTILWIIESRGNTYMIVTDGECYTYQNKLTWTNSDCYSTYKEAEAALQRHIDFKARQDAHENREWKAVTE